MVIATPMAGLEGLLRRIGGAEAAGVLWLCKGFQEGSGRFATRSRATSRRRCAAACSPAPASPSRWRAASPPRWWRRAATALAERAVEAFHGESLRVYTSSDPVGVEVGGAVKNVMAIATGIADGMAPG